MEDKRFPYGYDESNKGGCITNRMQYTTDAGESTSQVLHLESRSILRSLGMPDTSTVFIVDDEPSSRESLEFLLESVKYKTKSFASADAFLDFYQPSMPGCLLLDMRMPGASGLKLQQMLHEQGLRIPIIFVSGHVDVPTASKAFRAGACDVLTKPVDDTVLLDRVAEVLAEDKAYREALQRSAEARDRLELLTPKEREVFEQMLLGRTIKQLSVHFEVGFQTVAKHRSRVLEKLGVETDAKLIHKYRGVDLSMASA